MPKKRLNELIQTRYYRWVLRTRDGVFFADGRANRPSLGRHSLGTRDRERAMEALGELDLTKAVDNGKADRALLGLAAGTALDLDRGRAEYESHVRRPAAVGGGQAKTAQRYKAVFDKFIPFARSKGVTTWNRVTKRLLEQYAAHLDDERYAPRTEYLELTLLKQTMKWLVGEELIPATCLFEMHLPKPDGTDTYCWKAEEVAAMIDHCSKTPDLNWLGDVFVTLVCTGMRISELAALRWSDMDLTANTIYVKDESSSRKRAGRTARRTKSGRGRTIPIHSHLKEVLDRMEVAKDGIVFHGPRNGELKADTVRNVLVRAVLAPLADRFPTPPGEIGFVHGRLHSCRHYFASECAAQGFSEQVVMALLGHQDSAMARHYFHLHSETAQRHMGRLRLLGEAEGTVAGGKTTKGVPEARKEAKKENS